MRHEAEHRDRDDPLEGGGRKRKSLDITLDGRQGDTPRPGTLTGQPKHGRGGIECGHPGPFGGELHSQSPVTGPGVEDAALRPAPRR